MPVCMIVCMQAKPPRRDAPVTTNTEIFHETKNHSLEDLHKVKFA
jgi:hypothetical protein